MHELKSLIPDDKAACVSAACVIAACVSAACVSAAGCFVKTDRPLAHSGAPQVKGANKRETKKPLLTWRIGPFPERAPPFFNFRDSRLGPGGGGGGEVEEEEKRDGAESSSPDREVRLEPEERAAVGRLSGWCHCRTPQHHQHWRGTARRADGHSERGWERRYRAKASEMLCPCVCVCVICL